MTSNLVVVKAGTRSLTKDDGTLDLAEMGRLVDQVAEAMKRGYRVILVTSGAIASGIAELGVKPNPNDIVFRQACAAAGQSILMEHYRELFKRHGVKVAQVLLTEKDLSDRISYIHTCNVLDRLLHLGVVPIINENDVTSVNEIIPVMKGYKVNFSDNDILSVLIANATEADLVAILSTVDGLYSKNPDKPGAELIPVVEKITPELESAVEGKSRLGRGGMKTKLEAAGIAMRSGIPLVIANSRRENVLLDILEQKPVGTYFKPAERSPPSIKKWIAYGAGAKGQIHVNEGAKRAILDGASLLAVGVDRVSGQFQIGDVVSLVGPDGRELARGIVNYTSEELNMVKGMSTAQVRKALGYIRQKEVVIRKRMHLAEEEIDDVSNLIPEMCRKAKETSSKLAELSTEAKNRALCNMADALEKNSVEIIEANQKDVEASRKKGVKEALVDRLILNEGRISKMAQCLREVAELPDPVGEIVRTWTRPNGLIIGQLRVPLGVVAVIYESRPDVTSDASGICLKSGNAVILRGGSEAINSNIAVGKVLSEAAIGSGVPDGAIQVVPTTDRSAAVELMEMRGYVDVLIPRGGAELINAVVENAKVPVIETGVGNCHIYVENDADLERAVDIIINAKCQRPGVCNAAEKVLVNRDVASSFLPSLVKALRSHRVEVRGCKETQEIIRDVVPATEEDWYTEYLDLVIGIKVVGTLKEAIEHVNKYGTKHSESILTSDINKAMSFIKGVDSAAVYWNASTRFTDGNQYGLGAEIGISTQKIHARGPMSVQHLTTIKYFVIGRGHIRE